MSQHHGAGALRQSPTFERDLGDVYEDGHRDSNIEETYLWADFGLEDKIYTLIVVVGAALFSLGIIYSIIAKYDQKALLPLYWPYIGIACGCCVLVTALCRLYGWPSTFKFIIQIWIWLLVPPLYCIFHPLQTIAELRRHGILHYLSPWHCVARLCADLRRMLRSWILWLQDGDAPPRQWPNGLKAIGNCAILLLVIIVLWLIVCIVDRIIDGLIGFHPDTIYIWQMIQTYLFMGTLVLALSHKIWQDLNAPHD